MLDAQTEISAKASFAVAPTPGADRAEHAAYRTSPSSAPATTGFSAETYLATENGWVSAALLRPGMRVLTFDSGLVPVSEVQAIAPAAFQDLPRADWPLYIPKGTLGNRRPLTLGPEQHVLIESTRAELLLGEAFVLIPAAALEGWRGICRIAPAEVEPLVTVALVSAQILYAEGMTLLHAPNRDGRNALGQEGGGGVRYPLLPLPTARALLPE